MKVETLIANLFRFRGAAYLRVNYVGMVIYYKATDEGWITLNNDEDEAYIESLYTDQKGRQ